MALPQISRRTLMLAGLAIGMAGLTFYDYRVGLPDRGGGSSLDTGQPRAARNQAPRHALRQTGDGQSNSQSNGQSIAELENVLKHAEVIRQRYRTIAVPYAESVAGFATLYAPGEIPKDKAAAAIRSLIPAEVEIKDMLISEAPTTSGSLWLTASLSLTGSDSRAMIAALLALGDAANGMVWKELALGVDDERRQIAAKGRISLLMAQLAE